MTARSLGRRTGIGAACASLVVAAAACGGPPTPSTVVAAPSASSIASPAPTSSQLASVPLASAGASPSPSAQAGVVAERIRVPRLRIDLRIVEGDGIDAPIDLAAHYPGTAWPGGGSNIYIYGHARTGMFIGLWDARVGDEVFLDLVDGTTRRYVVDEIHPRTPWDAVHLLEPTPEERLTLQTSTSYTATAPRFVVIARPG